MEGLVVLAFLLLVWLFIRTTHYKEQFADATCADYDTCVSCANKTGCAWCPSTKACVSDDTACDGKVNDAPLCQADASMPQEAGKTISNTDVEENPLYHDQIQDRPAPPMVYLNKNMTYTPETVMANVSELRDDVHQLKQYIR